MKPIGIKGWFKIVCLLGSFLFGTIAYSQNGLDSLLHILSEIQDENEPADLDQKSILCNDIAVIYQGIGEERKSRFYFLQSIYFTKQRIEIEGNWDAQNNYDVAYLYNNLATFESTQGNAEESQKYIEEAEFYYNRLEPLLSREEYEWIMADFYETCFTLAYHRNDFEQGDYYIRKAINMIPEEEKEGLRAIEYYRLHGELYNRNNQLEEAETLFRKALNLAQKSPDNSINIDRYIHSLLVTLYYQGEFEEINEFLFGFDQYKSPNEAFKYAEQKNYTGLGSFMSNLFILSYANSNVYKVKPDTVYINSALRWQLTGFDLVEKYILENRAEKMKGGISNPKNKLLGLLTTYASYAEVNEVDSDLVSSILRVVDVYHSTRLHLERVSYEVNSELWREQKELKNQLNFLSLKLDEIREGGDKITVDSLRSASYETALKLHEVERQTKREKILEEYHVGQDGFGDLLNSYVNKTQKNILTYFYSDGRDSLFTIGLTPDTSFILAIAVPSDFRETIEESYDLNSRLLFEDSTIERQVELNKTIYSWLFQPVAPFLSSNEMLIYPLHEISYVSFDALIDSTGNYLVNSYSFQYATSLFSIIQGDNLERENTKWISFYPHNYGADSLAFLYNAAEEVQVLSELVDADNYEGREASKTKFLEIASEGKIIHLASHSVLNFDHPYESYILFDAGDDSSAGTEIENKLYAYEIFSKSLGTEMVVLSSCNSAKGKIEEGIGVVSLSNAFYFAGVPSTVSSLWSAQDKSSAAIMTSFYRYLKAGNSRSVSLQKAKSDYLNQADKIKSQPFFWANYVVYGSDTPLFEKNSKREALYAGIGAFILLIGGLFYLRSSRMRKAS